MHQVHRSGYHAVPRTRPMGLGLDLSGLRKDGAEFAAEISLAPLVVDGRPCVMAAVRDVTERKRIEERARLWRKAQEEVRERDEFLSIASHELRTPVAALQLQLQILQRAAQPVAPASSRARSSRSSRRSSGRPGASACSWESCSTSRACGSGGSSSRASRSTSRTSPATRSPTSATRSSAPGSRIVLDLAPDPRARSTARASSR